MQRTEENRQPQTHNHESQTSNNEHRDPQQTQNSQHNSILKF